MLIDNLANLNRSTRNTVFSALIIIATIAMYDWIVAPHVTCLFASQEYESAVSKAVEKNKITAREVEAKTKKLEELYRQLAESRSILFAPDEATAFFSDLQAIAEETGCTVHSLNLVANKPSSGDKRKQSEDTSGIVANSAMLTVSGQYNSIFRLVEKLQNHAKKIWLDSFEMKTIDFNAVQLRCDMTITIYTIQDKGTTL
jgi:cell division protein ZapA (FtsZ GTPase activity inhibitor)